MAKMYNNDAPGLKSLTRIKSPPTIWLRVTRGCTKSTGPLITSPPPKCGAKFFPRLSQAKTNPSHLKHIQAPWNRHHQTPSKTVQNPKDRGKSPNYLPNFGLDPNYFPSPPGDMHVYFHFTPEYLWYSDTLPPSGWKKLHRISSANLKRGQP